MAAGRGQSRPGAGYFWLNGASEHHADRVEEDELGMTSDGLGDRVPRRVGDEVRELFDSFTHPDLLDSLSGAVRLPGAVAPGPRSVSSTPGCSSPPHRRDQFLKSHSERLQN